MTFTVPFWGMIFAEQTLFVSFQWGEGDDMGAVFAQGKPGFTPSVGPDSAGDLVSDESEIWRTPDGHVCYGFLLKNECGPFTIFDLCGGSFG
jgi:hypothetical protein